MVVLTLFVSRTQLGRAMRATSYDRQAAEMMGIDVNRVIAATFFIGSALAGAAGVFNCLVYQQLNPYMGFQAGLKAFTAAVIGGIGNLPGAVVGGLAIGLAESFTIGYVSSTFSDAIVFVILIGIMIRGRAASSGAPRCRRSERWRTPEQQAEDRRRRVGRLARGPARARDRSQRGRAHLRRAHPRPGAVPRLHRRRRARCRS